MFVGAFPHLFFGGNVCSEAVVVLTPVSGVLQMTSG